MTDSTQTVKYKNILTSTNESTNSETSYSNIDNILENEKISNKRD